MQQKAYKHRVYPAEKQRTFFAKCLGTGLQVWRMLAYKLKRKGEKLVVIDKWFPSSQLCNICWYKDKKVKNLNVHSWIYPVCGTEHDRDENAAINILIEGLRILYEEMKAV